MWMDLFGLWSDSQKSEAGGAGCDRSQNLAASRVISSAGRSFQRRIEADTAFRAGHEAVQAHNTLCGFDPIAITGADRVDPTGADTVTAATARCGNDWPQY